MEVPLEPLASLVGGGDEAGARAAHLLLVPLAIVRPTFGVAWLIPLPMAVGPGTLNGRPWQTAVVLASFAALVLVGVRGEGSAAGRKPLVVAEAA